MKVIYLISKEREKKIKVKVNVVFQRCQYNKKEAKVKK